jgi:ribonuclease D
MQLVSDTTTLTEWLQPIGPGATLALDTEFMRERTYSPTLALVQVCDGTRVALLDPTLELDLHPLIHRVLDPTISKVWHSGRQDYEVLWPWLKANPPNLWDTQIGAALMGLKPQMGYAELVHTLLGVSVDKSQTRTNWLLRPLSDEQCAYAADDVRYLPPLFEKIKQHLDHLGRTGWWAEEMQRQPPPILDPLLAYERLKGLDRLPPLVRTRMCLLSIWREQEAQRMNVPRHWIVDDAGLERLSRESFPPPAVWPKIIHYQLKSIPNFEHAKRIVEEAVVDPRFDVTPLDRPSETEKKRLNQLRGRLHELAVELNLDETFLCQARQLKALARGADVHEVLEGWRAEVLATLTP